MRGIEGVRVSSWKKLEAELFDRTRNRTLRRFRSEYAFRGLSDASYELTTSLRRMQNNRYASMEHHLIRNFQKYARRDIDIVQSDTIWHWLSLAQHHGLPTRLLDWTLSPFIAMHFATANIENYDRDGVIWVVNRTKVRSCLPTHLQKRLNKEGAHAFTLDMLSKALKFCDSSEALKFFRYFDRMKGNSKDGRFVLFFEPPSLDSRIVNQYALFSIMNSPRKRLDSWFQKHSSTCRKIIIAAKLKWEIRDKLDISNINERMLFPGLDGLSSWLKRHYSTSYYN